MKRIQYVHDELRARVFWCDNFIYNFVTLHLLMVNIYARVDHSDVDNCAQ